MPTITGEIYVSNNGAIAEDSSLPTDKSSLNYFKRKFPNLIIRAQQISQSNITKYVQVLESGKIETIDLLRSTSSTPILTNIIPAKANYDFKGWATDAAGENILLEYNFETKEYGDMTAFNAYTIPNDSKVLTFYAIFEYHKHRVDFVYPDNSIVTKYVTWNTAVETPTEIPYKPDVDSNGNALPLEQTWGFLGWSTNRTAFEADERFTNGTFIVTKDYLASNNSGIYTVWSEEPISVFDNIHPEFFEIVDSNATFTDSYHESGVSTNFSGLEIRLAKNVKGKLTIPSTINNQPVIKLSSNNAGNSTVDPLLDNITHVFFAKEANGKTNVCMINNNAFRSCKNLEYFDFNNGLRYIGERAFQAVTNLKESTIIGGTIHQIGANAFTNAFAINDLESRDIIIDGSVKILGNEAFSNLNDVNTNANVSIYFGTSDNRSSITNFAKSFLNNISRIDAVNIYPANPSEYIFDSGNRYELLTNIFNATNDNITVNIL